MNAGVDVCFEHSKPCLFSSDVLKDAVVPNVFCSHGTGFQIPGYYLLIAM
jgi:hypothetical protein